MRTLALFIALIASATLSACVSTSAYGPQARAGDAGYSEQRIDEAHWRVEFIGDDAASAPIVERALLFRAAELTQASGYDWFKPSEHQADADTEIVVEGQRPTASTGMGSTWRPAWRRRSILGWSDWMPRGPMPHEERTPPPRVWSFVRYSAHETIEMGRGEKPANAFDAAAVAALLAPEVRPAP